MTAATRSMISNSTKETKAKETKFSFTRTLPRPPISPDFPRFPLTPFFGGQRVANPRRWSPDNAPIKSKMVYASSKEAMRRSFNGVGAEIQGTDYSEVSYESVLDKVSKGRA